MDWLFMLIAILTTFQAAYGTAKLSLRMDFLSIPAGKTKEKECCDGGIFVCSNKCDPYFKVCIDGDRNSQDDLNSCSVATFETAHIDDSIEIAFDDMIGSSDSPNPRVLNITSWPGVAFLKVGVIDHDDHKNDDVIDHLVTEINRTADASVTEKTETTLMLTNAVMLQASLYVYCDPHYYGPGCDMTCNPAERSDCPVQEKTKLIQPSETVQLGGQLTLEEKSVESTTQVVECPLVTQPENGDVTYPAGRNVNNTLVYRCKRGYVLQGCSTRWCQADGKWTPITPNPSCQVVQCPPASPPKSGFVTYPTGWSVNDTLVYRCEIGFTLEGSGKRQCQPDGKWSPVAVEPTCQPVIKIGALSSSGVRALPHTAVLGILLGITLAKILDRLYNS